MSLLSEIEAMFRMSMVTSITEVVAKSDDPERSAAVARAFYTRMGHEPAAIEEAIEIALKAREAAS